MSADNNHNVTRRGFGIGLSGISAALGIGVAPSAQAATDLDPFMRDAALRGLAQAHGRGDPVLAQRAEEAFVRLEQSDPEGALLGRIYQRLDTRPAAWWADDATDAAEADLRLVHGAIHAARAVAFDYFDLAGEMTSRSVLPLALVHPAQGIKLLAFCRKRNDFRQFFVRAMQNVRVTSCSFRAERLHLLKGLLDRETGSGPA